MKDSNTSSGAGTIPTPKAALDAASTKRQPLVALVYGGLVFLAPFLISQLPARSAQAMQLSLVEETDAELLLAYAGFAGCSTSCPVALVNLARTYEQLPPQATKVVFINVERDASVSLARVYARAFHPDFHAKTLDHTEAALFYRELGIRAYDSVRQALAHRNLIYVLRRQADAWSIVDLIDGSEPPPSLLKRIQQHLPQTREKTARTTRI